MKARVLKRMISDGKMLQSGDIVEVEKWRNTKSLISNRYIELLKDADVVEAPIKVEAKKPKAKADTKDEE